VQEKQPAPPAPSLALVKKSRAPRRWLAVSARSSPARNRSNPVFRVTAVRRKVACARNSVWSFTSFVKSFEASASAASTGKASRNSFTKAGTFMSSAD